MVSHSVARKVLAHVARCAILSCTQKVCLDAELSDGLGGYPLPHPSGLHCFRQQVALPPSSPHTHCCQQQQWRHQRHRCFHQWGVFRSCSRGYIPACAGVGWDTSGEGDIGDSEGEVGGTQRSQSPQDPCALASSRAFRAPISKHREALITYMLRILL